MHANEELFFGRGERLLIDFNAFKQIDSKFEKIFLLFIYTLRESEWESESRQ